MRVFTEVDDETYALIHGVISEFHPHLNEVGCHVAALMVEDSKGAWPITSRGYLVAADIHVISPMYGALGLGDACIRISKPAWDERTERQQRALIDHELTHLVLKAGKFNVIQSLKQLQHLVPERDDNGRLKCGLVDHDWRSEGFTRVAQRWGSDAGEVMLAKSCVHPADKTTYLWELLETPTQAGGVR